MATAAITITDTGKRRTSSGSAEETDKANSGTAITLYGAEISLEEEANLNESPSVSKLSGGSGTMYAVGEVDHLGVKKPKWIINGVLDDTVTADLQKIKILRDLSRTKGYKTLGGTLPDWVDGTLNSSTVNVRIRSVSVKHSASNNVITYQINLTETE